MVKARTTIPVVDALGARVLEAQVLLRVRVVDDLALLELARRAGERERVVVRAEPAGLVAAPAVVRDGRARGVVVRPAVVGVGDAADYGA